MPTSRWERIEELFADCVGREEVGFVVPTPRAPELQVGLVNEGGPAVAPDVQTTCAWALESVRACS